MNRVILKGYVGRNIEFQKTQDGRDLVLFSLVTFKPWTTQQGEKSSTTDWHKVVIFKESIIEHLVPRLETGDLIYVEGVLTYEPKKDKFNNARLEARVTVSKYDGNIQRLLPARKASQTTQDSQLASVSLTPTPQTHQNSASPPISEGDLN